MLQVWHGFDSWIFGAKIHFSLGFNILSFSKHWIFLPSPKISHFCHIPISHDGRNQKGARPHSRPRRPMCFFWSCLVIFGHNDSKNDDLSSRLRHCATVMWDWYVTKMTNFWWGQNLDPREKWFWTPKREEPNSRPSFVLYCFNRYGFRICRRLKFLRYINLRRWK